MVFGSNKSKELITNRHLFINQDSLTRVTKTTFLGITITENLNWNEHINKICNKMSSGLYALNRVKSILPKQHLKLIYSSLIQSHMNYGIILWGNAPQKLKHRVEVLQKKAVRIITGSDYNAPTTGLFKSLKILKFNDLYNLQLTNYMYMVINKLLPKQLCKLVNSCKINHKYNTRQHIRLPLFKKKICQSSFMYTGPKLWSNLPQILTQMHNGKSVSNKIRHNFISSY